MREDKDSERKRRWYLNNKEKVRLRRIELRLNNLVEHQERDRKKRQKPEYKLRMRAYLKKWKEQNREKINKYQKTRQEKRRATPRIKKIRILKTHEELAIKARLRNKAYYNRHRVKIMKGVVAIHKRRMKTDIGYRIKTYLRTRIWKAVRGVSKHKPTMDLLGCSVEELKDHLERQFKPGMTWLNYGTKGWVIDHIIPLASFNLQNKSELEKAAHHSNLQPMWDMENRKKWSKVC